MSAPRPVLFPFFAGGHYEGYSIPLNAQQCINLFPVVDLKGGKQRAALFGSPGMVEFADTATASEVRAMLSTPTFLYAVAGSSVFKIDRTGAVSEFTGVKLGTGSGPVSLAHDGTYLVAVDATGGKGYYADLTAGSVPALAQITHASFPSPTSLTWMDGYFIVGKKDTGEFYTSDLDDPTTWNAANFATAEADPDSLVLAFMDHQVLWLFGRRTVERWYNSGSTFPFDPVSGAPFSYGMEARDSLVAKDNALFWLGDGNQVLMARGGEPQIISPPQLSQALESYAQTDDAIGIPMHHHGLDFYCLTFPTANVTWVYDIALGEWHQRAYNNEGALDRHRANCGAEFFRMSLVGDRENGKIYRLDQDAYTDGGVHIIRRRRAPVIHDDRALIRFHGLEVEAEAGVGLSGTGTGSDPKAVLRWSDDGGRTWGNEHHRSMGKLGEYRARCRWDRLGASRARVFEWSCSEPVKVVVIGAYLDASSRGRKLRVDTR